MASLLIGATILTYDSLKKSSQKRRAKKSSFNNTRFSELERENAARIANLQKTTCFCQTSDWRGGGCDVHGYVPAAGEPGGPPAYREEPSLQRRRRRMSEGMGATETEEPYQYVRGQEDGFLASSPPIHNENQLSSYSPSPSHLQSQSMVDLTDGDGEWTKAPGSMDDEEKRRINEERRRKMKGKGWRGVVGWRRDKGEKVVR